MTDLRRLPGYRGPRQTPDAGSPLRAAYDAMHANWCGHECTPGCRQWEPDIDGLQAAIIAWTDATGTEREGWQAAQGLASDLTALATQYDELVDAVTCALIDAGGWVEIDGDGTELSILPDFIRRLGERDAPRWEWKRRLAQSESGTEADQQQRIDTEVGHGFSLTDDEWQAFAEGAGIDPEAGL